MSKLLGSGLQPDAAANSRYQTPAVKVVPGPGTHPIPGSGRPTPPAVEKIGEALVAGNKADAAQWSAETGIALQDPRVIDYARGIETTAEPSGRDTMVQGLLGLTPLPVVGKLLSTGEKAIAARIASNAGQVVAKTGLKLAAGTGEMAVVNALSSLPDAVKDPAAWAKAQVAALPQDLIMGGGARAILHPILATFAKKNGIAPEQQAQVHSALEDAIRERENGENSRYIQAMQSAKSPETAPVQAVTPPVVQKAGVETPAPANIANLKIGQEMMMPTDQITCKPGVMQYKESNSPGDTPYNPAFADTLDLWKDPNTGENVLVNGHRRDAWARQDGIPQQRVRFIDVPTAEEARLYGALKNIAQGSGTAVDAAKVFRESQLTQDQLAAKGVSLKSGVARDGMGLANLSPDLFHKVANTGEISVDQGSTIGRMVSDPAQQQAIAKLLTTPKGKSITKDTLPEVIREVQNAPTVTKAGDQTALPGFGEEWVTKNLIIEKADLSAYIKNQLKSDKGLFKRVSDNAETLKRGNNVIDQDASKAISERAAQVEQVFDSLRANKGSVSAALNDGAVRIANGENPNGVKADTYKAIQAAVQQTLAGGDAPGSLSTEERPGRVRTEPGDQSATPVTPEVTYTEPAAKPEPALTSAPESAPAEPAPKPEPPSILGSQSGKVLAIPDAVRAAGNISTAGRSAMQLATATHRLLNAGTASPDAAATAGVLREHLGKFHQVEAQLSNTYDDISNRMAGEVNNNLEAVKGLIQNYTSGKPVDPKYTPVTAALKDMEERLAKPMIQSFKGEDYDNWRTHYLPAMYADPEAAAQALEGLKKGNLLGNKSFLKPKTFQDVVQAYNYGEALVKGGQVDKNPFIPATWNPVELMQRHVQQVAKVKLLNDFTTDLKVNGLYKLVRPEDAPPQGWQKIDNPGGRVASWQDTHGGNVQDNGQPYAPQLVEHGNYYAPPDAKLIIDRWLSPTLWGNEAYDTARAATNSFTRMQFALNAFHASFTGLNSSIVHASRAVMQLFNGQANAATVGELAKSAVPFAQLPGDLARGHALRGEYLNPGVHSELGDSVSNLIKGNAGFGLDNFYGDTALGDLKASWARKEFGHAIAGAIPGAVTGMTSPIFKYEVPYVKLSLSSKIAEDLLAKHPNATPTERLQLIDQAVDHVDNVFGQFQSENTFQPRVMRDIAHLMTRAYYWAYGSYRMGGQAISDTALQAAAKVTGNGSKLPITLQHMTPNQAYVVTAAAKIAAWDAMTQIALTKYYTGHVIYPNQLKDYAFPRTGLKNDRGDDERLSTPTYVGEVSGLLHRGPLGQAETKLGALPKGVWDAITNHDYTTANGYNVPISKPGTPFAQDMEQRMLHILKQAEPIGVEKETPKELFGNKGTPERIGAFAGLGKAPGYITSPDKTSGGVSF